ncbi:YqgE/AlgH family protein [Terrirubrum flagellatum]|uniref:YqgE/AlgH family protein n=1 Tax=Terrirubrum flagellatum TaxID=2895980 RepID=UPI003CC813ED
MKAKGPRGSIPPLGDDAKRLRIGMPISSIGSRSLKSAADRGFLDGQFLVAMPGMGDDRFAKSVIYMCAHTSEGSMGLVLNQRAPQMKLPQLLVQLGLVQAGEAIMLPDKAQRVNVLRGGPVETGRGFVLHSADFFVESATMPVDDGLCLTTTVDVLKAIARGEGPDRAVLALGYAGWSAGQVEYEMKENAWLSCPADLDLIFDDGIETKYDRVMRKLGVDPAMLSANAGRA